MESRTCLVTLQCKAWDNSIKEIHGVWICPGHSHLSGATWQQFALGNYIPALHSTTWLMWQTPYRGLLKKINNKKTEQDCAYAWTGHPTGHQPV